MRLGKRGALAMSASRRDGILIVTTAGVATAECISKLREFIIEELAREPALAAVVDFRQAVQWMSDEDWEAAGRASVQANFNVRTAIVVSEVSLQRVRQHCMDLASYGLRRMAFTDLEPALSWAAGAAPRKPAARVRRPSKRPSAPSA
jgi:hypothetical protein